MLSVARALDISTGNLTFHFPTKEHLLAELVDMLCAFNWEQMQKEADDGVSSVLALCLKLTAMAGACTDDQVIKDFFLSSYASPLCLEVIRKHDAQRAKEIFKNDLADWTDEQFAEAEILVSGIEYATLMTVGDPVSFETRLTGALHAILGIYRIPEQTRNIKIQKVFSMDYRNIGKQTIVRFREYVENSTDHALRDMLK